jgi:hypothetical protein
LETQLVVVAGEGPKGNGRQVLVSIFLVFWNASCLALRRVRVYWLAANTPRHHKKSGDGKPSPLRKTRI